MIRHKYRDAYKLYNICVSYMYVMCVVYALYVCVCRRRLIVLLNILVVSSTLFYSSPKKPELHSFSVCVCVCMCVMCISLATFASALSICGCCMLIYIHICLYIFVWSVHCRYRLRAIWLGRVADRICEQATEFFRVSEEQPTVRNIHVTLQQRLSANFIYVYVRM